MNKDALQAYLYEHIPLSRAMAVQVVTATPDEVELFAPLAPNINHRGTAFGGSISTLATLACWSLLRVRTDGLDPLPHLVVARNSIQYLRPVEGDFHAFCRFPSDQDWSALLLQLNTRKRARLGLHAEIRYQQEIAARFEGDFVALAR